MLRFREVEAHTEHAHDHHELPTEGAAVWGLSVNATLHCLTGCAIGEVTGMVIGTALGFSDLGTVALAVGLAFLFGYSLTSLPLLRAGLALSAVIPIALATDTVSIAVMEIVNNGVMLAVPGAMEGVGSILFWGTLSFALAVAFVVTVPVNRWLLARGKGHTAVHETGIHGGPNPKLVGAAVVLAAVFGSAVLITEWAGGEEEAHGGGGHETSAPASDHSTDPEEAIMSSAGDHSVPGLAIAADGLELELGQTELAQGRESEFSFTIVTPGGEPVTDFDVEHEKEMHLIVVRRDLTGFRHLHPEMSEDGTWSTDFTVPDAGSYRVFADFSSGGVSQTLGADVAVDGDVDWRELPPPEPTAATGGYEVELSGAGSGAGAESELAFAITRGGRPVDVEPYLGADGHLVALREGDLGFLHVHPLDADRSDGAIRFMTEFPSAGRYRLFAQFKHEGEVHTAAFTPEVG